MLPEVLADDRLLQGQKAIDHFGLAGPRSRRVIFRKEKSRGGWGRWGAAGQRAEVSRDFFLLFFLDGNRTRPKGHQK